MREGFHEVLIVALRKEESLVSLREQIELNKNDISGSRTKNRLTVQISYAMQLIMEYYSMDYAILMDYVEDVVIIENPDEPTGIHLYQVKTKSTDKQYLLTTVIKDEWFQKLYKNAQKYAGNVNEAALVCNTDIINNKENIFANEHNCLEDIKDNANIKKIVKAIADDLNIAEGEVDLSKFYFVKSNLSTKGHKDEVEHQFENFLLEEDSGLQITTARAIFRIIYDELDARFNWELDENCSDINEIYKKKGLVSNSIRNVITTGLAVQLPNTNQLFEKFQIKSVREMREYSQRYPMIKMDMFSKKEVLINTKKHIVAYIDDAVNSGFDEFPVILGVVYEKCIEDANIPSSYSEEYYLKLLIMLLAYKYCYGGDSN